MVSYLFLFIVDIFGYMLDDPKNNLEGFTLPNQINNTNSLFANNTLLLLKRESNNIQRKMRILDIYCEAPIAKINWYKTFKIWACQRIQNLN